MNFTHFQGIENSDTYFWKIAIPFIFVTTCFLMYVLSCYLTMAFELTNDDLGVIKSSVMQSCLLKGVLLPARESNDGKENNREPVSSIVLDQFLKEACTYLYLVHCFSSYIDTFGRFNPNTIDVASCYYKNKAYAHPDSTSISDIPTSTNISPVKLQQLNIHINKFCRFLNYKPYHQV